MASPLLKGAYNSVTFVTSIVDLVILWVFIKAVYRIVKKLREMVEELNWVNLFFHSVAFGLYTLVYLLETYDIMTEQEDSTLLVYFHAGTSFIS